MALRLGLMAVDGASAAGVFLLVALVRFGDGEWMEIWQRLSIDIRAAAILWGLAWVAALWYEGLYRLSVRWRALSELKDIGKATLLVAALTLSTLFVLKQENVSRLFLLILFVVQPLVTFTGRAILRAGFGFLGRRGYNARYMLVVGTGRLAEEFANRVEGRAALGIRVIGHLAVPGEPRQVVTRQVLGNVDGIAAIFHSSIVDEVAVCLPPEAAGHLEAVVGLAADEGKTVRIAVDPMDGVVPKASQEEFEGLLIRSLVHDSGREVGLVLKRLIDIVGAGAGLVVLSPLLLGTALLIRARDGSPVLFRQTRIGLHGRPFRICKFRTMVPDAEVRLGEVADLNELRGAAFKVTDDPRITPLGRSLRMTSIDELPQLWNVLKGEMSLVGPRPPLADEVNGYDIWHRRRLSMKPGMTGLWQIEARRDPDFDRWVERDLIYIDQWSMWLDVRILARTVPAVLTKAGR